MPFPPFATNLRESDGKRRPIDTGQDDGELRGLFADTINRSGKSLSPPALAGGGI